jgi:hypothetical protein
MSAGDSTCVASSAVYLAGCSLFFRLKFLPRSLWQLPHLQVVLGDLRFSFFLTSCFVLQVLSLRKNDLQWLPPDAAKMKSMQQINVTGLIQCFLVI